MGCRPHHRDWVWSTRSLNNITLGGQGQVKRSASSKAEILAFETAPTKSKNVEFVTLYRPHRESATPPRAATLEKIDGGYVLTADVVDGRVMALLPTSDTANLISEGPSSAGAIVIQHRRADGTVTQTVDVGNRDSET